jgi:hypothetical protein
MYTLQLGDNLFVDLEIGDIFVFKYDDSHFAIREVKRDYRPNLDENTVEIISFYSKKHFIFKRDNGYY